MSEDENEALRKSRELIYDNEVAPKLAELAKICNANGMGLFASVINSGDVYRTSQGELKDPQVRLIYYAMKCLGNVDLLIGLILEDAKKYGHNSVYVSLLEKKS